MPTKPPTWEDTVEDTPPKWEETEDIASAAEPPGYVPESLPMETPRVPVLTPSPLSPIPFPQGTAPTIPASPTESLMAPTFEALRAKSLPGQGAVAGLAKGAYNLALGIPEFATSTAGMGAAVVAPILPRVTSGAFTIDIFRNLFKQIPEVYEQWDKLTPGQKVQAGTELVGGALMGTALGAKTIKGWGRQPMGQANETQRQAVQFTQELAQKDPAKFGQMAQDAIKKAAEIEQREPGPTPPLPLVPAEERKEAVEPEAVSPPTAAAQAVAAAGQAPAAAAAPIPEARTLPAQAAAEASVRAAAIQKPAWVINLEAVEKAGNLNQAQAQRLAKWRAENEPVAPAAEPIFDVIVNRGQGTSDAMATRMSDGTWFLNGERVSDVNDLEFLEEHFKSKQQASPAAETKGAPSAERIREEPGQVPPPGIEPQGGKKEGGHPVELGAPVEPEPMGARGETPPPTLPNAPAREPVLAEPPPKESLTVEPKGKEPWEMGQQEWQDMRHVLRRTMESSVDPNVRAYLEEKLKTFARTWEEQIRFAKSEGKPVPPEVLKDYPDLQPPSKTAEGKGDAFVVRTKGRSLGAKAIVKTDFPEAPTLESKGQEIPARFKFPGGESLVSKDIATGKWRVTEFTINPDQSLKPLRHDIYDTYTDALKSEQSNKNRRRIIINIGEPFINHEYPPAIATKSGTIFAADTHEIALNAVAKANEFPVIHNYRGFVDEHGNWMTLMDVARKKMSPAPAAETGAPKFETRGPSVKAQKFERVDVNSLITEFERRYPPVSQFIKTNPRGPTESLAAYTERLKASVPLTQSDVPILQKIVDALDKNALAVKADIATEHSPRTRRLIEADLSNVKGLREKYAALLEKAKQSPAAETGEKGLGEGPGALTAGTSPTGKSQIEQLADAFRNKAPAKERAWQLVRQSFDFGQRAAAAKDAFSRVLSGINTARKAAQTALTSFEKPDDLLKAKGELSASVETRGWQAREFSKAVKQDTPDIRKRIAMSKWIEADGDPAKLAVGEAATKPEFKQGYRDAQNLTPDEQIKAQNISNYFEARLQEAIDAGVLETGVEDYIHRIYPKDSPFRQRALAYVQSGILSKNPSLAKKRLFEWDWQAEAAGLRPVQDMLPRIIDYETSLSKAIAARQFIAKLTQMKGPDGRPVIGIKGVGVPVTDPSGVRTATVIKPLGDFKKANNPADPLNYRGDYVNKEYGSLSRWKWVGTDTDGKPIFLQGDVAIHPAFVGRVQALLEPSHVRYGRYPRLGQTLLGVGSTVKQTMLDLSGFHQVQIAVHGLEHRVNPFHLVQDIDFADPKMQGLLKGGLTLGGEFHESHMGEGLVGRSLTQHVPVLGPLLETYHNWLFQDFIPRVKTTMALHALERNRARYAKDLASGKMTEADLNYLTAKQANAAFGELNYITMERSKTTQDLARLIMLAPDFLEARAKFVGQALTKYGTEQRMALLFGALAMYSAARVLNKIIDDQYHLEPENLFNVVKGNTRYSLRTVQGDVLHAITRPLSFWLNRLNPVYSRTLLELISQRDQFGRKRDLRQILGDTVSTVRPIALRSSREQSLLQSIWNAFGVTARRYDDVQEARKLADDWKKKNKVREAPGEFIYDSDKDPLRPLKLALSDNDDGGAVAEIRKVLQGKVMTLPKMDDYFRRYAKANFTGSAFNERKWMQSLSADDRKTVQAAQQHRQAMLRLYYQARQQYFTALNASK